MTHHDYSIFSYFELFQDQGVLGGNGIVNMPKCEATQIYLLAENPEQAYPKSSKLNTSENKH